MTKIVKSWQERWEVDEKTSSAGIIDVIPYFKKHSISCSAECSSECPVRDYIINVTLLHFKLAVRKASIYYMVAQLWGFET